MVIPALVAIAISAGAALENGAWAIPVATDIAFALGVLSLAGTALPAGVRVLLLAIAVIDDLLAITLIAIVFTDPMRLAWIATAPLPRRRVLAGVPASPRPRLGPVAASRGGLDRRPCQRRPRHRRRDPARATDATQAPRQ
jgi:hypothetical protein